MCMTNLRELRAAMRKVNTRIKIVRYSDFSTVVYVYNNKEIHGNVFSPEFLEEIKPMIDFINDHKDEIRDIFKAEGLNGWSKFVKEESCSA